MVVTLKYVYIYIRIYIEIKYLLTHQVFFSDLFQKFM